MCIIRTVIRPVSFATSTFPIWVTTVCKILSGATLVFAYYKDTTMEGNTPQKETRCWSQRYTFALMGFFGMGLTAMMRMNITVAIVAMVNSNSSDVTAAAEDTCPEVSTIFKEDATGTSGEFDWNEQEQSIVLGAWSYGFLMSLIPSGYLSARFGGKYVFILSCMGMSVATLLSPLAARANVGLLIFARILVGLCAGSRNPIMHSMLAKWSPPAERSRMSSYVYSGFQIGNVFGIILTGILCDTTFMGGWPAPFYICGILGLVWCFLAVFLIYDSPDVHPRISAAEKEYIISSLGNSVQKKGKRVIPWRSILKSMTVWAIIIPQIAQCWNSFTLVTELPTYFSNIYHVNATTTSFLMAIPCLLSWFCSTLFGISSDALRKRGIMTSTGTRKFFHVISHGGSIITCLCLSFIGCNYVAAILLFILAIATNGAMLSAHYTNHIDLSPNFAGTLTAITSTIGNSLGSIPAPIIVGLLLNGNPSLTQWRYAFLLDAILLFCAGIVYLTFASGEEQPWNRAQLEDSASSVTADIPADSPPNSCADVDNEERVQE